VRAMRLDGVDIGRRDNLVRLLPAGADKAAAAAKLLVGGAEDRISLDRRPGIDGIAANLLLRPPPELQEPAADHRIFQAIRRIDIPAVARPARAAARLVIGQVGAGARIIRLL